MIFVRSRTHFTTLALLLGLVATSLHAPAVAQPARPQILAKVDSFQTPAWVERGGIQASLKAGWAIFAGDRVFTGAGGRVQLSVIGEGKLKLAADSEVLFASQLVSATGTDLPLFDVRRGTFHFTAPMAPRPDAAGTVIALNGLATANVRGGQSVGRHDQICLLDGAVNLTGSDGKTVVLNKLQHVANVTSAGAVLAPIPIPQERLASWLGQLQPAGGRPTLVADGVWDVSMGSGYNLRELEELACRIQKRGYPSEIYPVREPGKQVWYRVLVRRFASKSDAVGFLGTAKALGSKEPWVLLPAT